MHGTSVLSDTYSGITRHTFPIWTDTIVLPSRGRGLCEAVLARVAVGHSLAWGNVSNTDLWSTLIEDPVSRRHLHWTPATKASNDRSSFRGTVSGAVSESASVAAVCVDPVEVKFSGDPCSRVRCLGPLRRFLSGTDTRLSNVRPGRNRNRPCHGSDRPSRDGPVSRTRNRRGKAAPVQIYHERLHDAAETQHSLGPCLSTCFSNSPIRSRIWPSIAWVPDSDSTRLTVAASASEDFQPNFSVLISVKFLCHSVWRV